MHRPNTQTARPYGTPWKKAERGKNAQLAYSFDIALQNEFLKQRRVYELDEDGNRIRDQNGEYVFNAVPTTDWGSPETLEHWRQTWAELCNAKFAEKGLDVRIDHRSYERQGVDLLPTIHEGATVRAMEKKGIRTEKGEFNRWIKATNAVIRDIKKKITLAYGLDSGYEKPSLPSHRHPTLFLC